MNNVRLPVPEDNTDRQPFIAHLEELRITILKCIVAYVIFLIACFVFSPHIFAILQAPLVSIVEYSGEAPGELLRTLNPTGAFSMALKISAACGLICALPFILYFAASFIVPALSSNEKKYLLPVFSLGAVLFLSGVIFCYYCVLPISLKFLWNFAEWFGVKSAWTLEYYITFATRFLLVFGIVFELPLIILTLVKLHILSYMILIVYRKYVIVGVFILAALLTPPDVVSQLLLAVPLWGLYELSVWGAWLIEKKNASSDRLAG